jgi:predicted MFS family arabinose efflux permease
MSELVEQPTFAALLPPKTSSLRGWLVVGGCFMGVLIGPALVASTFSVFFAALLESVPWSRASTAFAYSLYVLLYGVSGPIVGRLCTTLGPQKVLLSGAVLIAVGGVLLSRVQEVWQFCVLYGALGVTAGMTGVVPVTVLISRWFVDQRGLALGIAYSGTTGALALSPLAQSLVAAIGWRRAYFLIGMIAGALLFLVVLATVRDAPPREDHETTNSRDPHSPTPQASDPSRIKRAFRTPSFWLLAGSGFLFFSVLTAVFSHVIPLASDRGVAKGVAALSLGLMIGIGTIGKVGAGYLADHYDAGKILVWTFLGQAGVLGLLAWGQSTTLFWVFVLLFGIGQGGALTLAPMILGHLFGVQALGSLVGAYWLIATVGSLIGPPAAGAMRDATGAYSLVLLFFTAALLGSAVLVHVLRHTTAAASSLASPLTTR